MPAGATASSDRRQTPGSSLLPEKGGVPPKVASQATQAGTRNRVTRRTFVTRRNVYQTEEPDVPEPERTPSPTRPETELGPGGRYLTSFIDNWAPIMFTHVRVLENKSFQGLELDEFAARHSIPVNNFSLSSGLFYFIAY